MNLQDLGRWASLVIILSAAYILWRIRNLLLLLFLAVLISTLLNNGVRQLTRLKLPRPLAVMITVSAVLSGLALLGIAVVPPLTAQFQELVDLIPMGISNIETWFDDGRLIPRIPQQDSHNLQGWLRQLQTLDFQAILTQFFALFSNTLTITLNILLVLVLSIMLLANPQPYRKTMARLFPQSQRGQTYAILDRCESIISHWFIGIVFNMLVIAVSSSLGLWLLGVPLPLANGLLAGLLTFLPNIGPVISVLPPAAIALIDSPLKAASVVGLYIIIQQLESNILTPLVMRHQVSLLPALTLLAQVFFAIFFGFLGLFLALPLALVAQVWLEELWLKPVLDQI